MPLARNRHLSLLSAFALLALAGGIAWFAMTRGMGQAQGRSLLMPAPVEAAAPGTDNVTDLEQVPVRREESSAPREQGPVEELSVAFVPDPVLEPADKPAMAVIRGVVLDEMELPFESARVELFELGREVLLERTMSPGSSFEFEVAAAGTYVVRLAVATLPPGILGPWHQDSTSDDDDAHLARRVEIPAEGGLFDVELRVFMAATVSGRILGSRGEPVDRAEVRVASASSVLPGNMFVSGKSNRDGYFLIEGLYAGLHRVRVSVEGELSPIPIEVGLEGGANLDVGVLRVGGGSNTIRGRVVDQDGRPFVGLGLFAWAGGEPSKGFLPMKSNIRLASTVTDAFGGYELHSLPAARIRVAPEHYGELPLGERRAAFWVNAIELDLRSDPGIADAGQLVVPESRPFTVRGSVELDPGWASASHMTHADLRVVAELARDPLAADITARRPSLQFAQVLNIDKESGTFQWSCETPQHRVKLTVSLRRSELEPLEFLIVPVPNETLELSLSFPPSSGDVK